MKHRVYCRPTRSRDLLRAVVRLQLILFLGTASVEGSEASDRAILSRLIDSTTGEFHSAHRLYRPSEPREFSNETWVETRWSIPTGTRVSLSDTGELSFPDGSLLSKTFWLRLHNRGKAEDHCYRSPIENTDPEDRTSSFGTRRCAIELRLLARENGQWSGHVFEKVSTGRWTPIPGGMEFSMRRVSSTTGNTINLPYSIPSIGQCRSCHFGRRDAPVFGPIGMNAFRLEERSMLAILALASLPSKLRDRLERRSWELGSSLPARRYLDANCGYCHNPSGLAASSGVFLDLREDDDSRLGICKRPAAVGRTYGWGQLDIVPGHPERSILLGRMSSLEAGFAMPELGRNLVDTKGVAIVSAWISSLNGDCDPGR